VRTRKRPSWFQTLIPLWMSYSLGDNPASEFYVPTFRNTLFHIRRSCKQKRISSRLFFLFTRPIKMEQCSETSAHKIQKPGKHPLPLPPPPQKKNTARELFGRFWKAWSWSPDLQNEDHLYHLTKGWFSSEKCGQWPVIMHDNSNACCLGSFGNWQYCRHWKEMLSPS
jgi:hypothetical protein